jgi:putative membrane protein
VWLAAPVPAAAHPGLELWPGEVWRAWTLDPWVLLGVGIPAWLYGRGVGRLWSRAGVGRGIGVWQFRAYCAGLLVLLLALLSPLHALGGALFSAHMVQHEVLILVAAPLLALGAPTVAFAWALPREATVRLGRLVRAEPIRSAWSAVSHPLGAWWIHAVALWVWHVPSLYQATLASELVHTAQHVSFFGTALLFWWVLFRMRRGPLGYGAGVLFVFTTGLYSNALGALLTFSSTPWYPVYGETVGRWGLSALEDQQLGGLFMWIPAGLVYLVVALVLVARWIQLAEARASAA